MKEPNAPSLQRLAIEIATRPTEVVEAEDLDRRIRVEQAIDQRAAENPELPETRTFTSCVCARI